MADNATHFCMLLGAQEAPGKTKAALLNQYRWEPGTDIRVRFIEGDPKLRERVKKVASEWTGPNMANLRLKWVESGPADIRIAFRQGNGSWSYLGTMCQQIPVNQPTMNFGWLTPTSGDEVLRPVVLHEFGHALGLIHEHQNPDRPIAWNRAALKHDLAGPPNNWDEATIENNMFKRYDARSLMTTQVDGRSIMMYPIPASWTTDGFSAGFNTDLSETDKKFIRNAYPW